MHPSSFHYFPLAWPFLLILAILFIAAIALIEFHVLEYAYERMGINRRYVFLILLLSFLGSYVNIPVAVLPHEPVESNRVVSYYGVQYVVPEVEEWPRTVLAVNVGGALIPTVLSIYLLVRNRLYLPGLLGTAAVAGIVHLLAHPVKGVGIAVPTFVPPLVAAGVALLLTRRKAPPLAYIIGTMGTLLGADILNLGQVAGLGAPVASIGGAGTFDAVFLTGIIAVLLA